MCRTCFIVLISPIWVPLVIIFLIYKILQFLTIKTCNFLTFVLFHPNTTWFILLVIKEIKEWFLNLFIQIFVNPFLALFSMTKRNHKSTRIRAGLKVFLPKTLRITRTTTMVDTLLPLFKSLVIIVLIEMFQIVVLFCKMTIFFCSWISTITKQSTSFMFRKITIIGEFILFGILIPLLIFIALLGILFWKFIAVPTAKLIAFVVTKTGKGIKITSIALWANVAVPVGKCLKIIVVKAGLIFLKFGKMIKMCFVFIGV